MSTIIRVLSILPPLDEHRIVNIARSFVSIKIYDTCLICNSEADWIDGNAKADADPDYSSKVWQSGLARLDGIAGQALTPIGTNLCGHPAAAG